MSADPKTFSVLLTVISSSSNAVNARSPDTLILLKYDVPVDVISPLKSPEALSNATVESAAITSPSKSPVTLPVTLPIRSPVTLPYNLASVVLLPVCRTGAAPPGK